MKYKILTVTGHRGAPDEAPENTISSFRRAIELGVDCIELDARRTLDGELVVIHDKTVDRTTNGTGNVSSYTLEKLKRLDAGSWFSKKYRGEKIPTLREALDVILNNDIFVEVELKDKGIEEDVGRLLEEIGAMNVLVSSFDKNAIKTFKEMFSSFPTVLISMDFRNGLIKEVLSSFANRIDLYHSFISREVVKFIHMNGLTVNGWVIDTQEDLERMINSNVDNITTNKPRFILNVLHRIME